MLIDQMTKIFPTTPPLELPDYVPLWDYDIILPEHAMKLMPPEAPTKQLASLPLVTRCADLMRKYWGLSKTQTLAYLIPWVPTTKRQDVQCRRWRNPSTLDCVRALCVSSSYVRQMRSLYAVTSSNRWRDLQRGEAGMRALTREAEAQGRLVYHFGPEPVYDGYDVFGCGV